MRRFVAANAVPVMWFAIGVACFPALAQAPLPAVQANRTSRGWSMTLRNARPSAATAMAIRMTYTGPGGNAGHAMHLEDSAAEPRPSRFGLPASGSRVIPMGGPSFQNVGYSVAAVIYADGTSAGDPAVVAHILRVRQAELTDIEQVLPILAAAGNPSASRAALIQVFARRQAAYRDTMEDGIAPPVDRICGTVLVNLRHPVNPQATLQQQASNLETLLMGWQDQLLASKPALQR